MTRTVFKRKFQGRAEELFRALGRCRSLVHPRPSLTACSSFRCKIQMILSDEANPSSLQLPSTIQRCGSGISVDIAGVLYGFLLFDRFTCRHRFVFISLLFRRMTCVCFADTSRLVGWSLRWQEVVWRLRSHFVGDLSADTSCSKGPFRHPSVASCSLRVLRWFPVSCSTGTDCSMVGSEIPFYSCRSDIRGRSCWYSCRDAIVWSSVRSRFRWRLAVRLLRVWHGRLCLVSRLGSSLLWLSRDTPTNIDDWAWILGEGDWYHGACRPPSNPVSKNCHLSSSLGADRCMLCLQLGL